MDDPIHNFCHLLLRIPEGKGKTKTKLNFWTYKCFRRFFKSIISILEEYQLDGVDLLWKWAKNSNTKKCSRFLCELKQKLKERKKNYVLSVQILPDEPSSWELFNPANGSPLNIQVEDCNTGRFKYLSVARLPTGGCFDKFQT